MNTIERSAPISSCGTWARKLISLLADSASPVGKWSAHPIPLSTSVHICPHLSTSVHFQMVHCLLPVVRCGNLAAHIGKTSPAWRTATQSDIANWFLGTSKVVVSFKSRWPLFIPSLIHAAQQFLIYICIEHQESKLGNTNTWIKCKVDHSSRFFEFWSSSLSGCPVLV